MLAEGDIWLQTDIPIGTIKCIVNKKPKKKPTQKRPRTAGKKGRHVTFIPGPTYSCIREGSRVFSNELEIDELYKQKNLEESVFYIFRHTDVHLDRNEEIPVYEAVYNVNGTFVKAQKCHMTQAYVKSKRTKLDLMWSVVQDETPYWVDRYAFSKEKQRMSKLRKREK